MDKDKAVTHLLDALDGVSKMLDELQYNDYFCCDCADASDYSGAFYDDIEKIRDYIWHKKADIAV